MDTYEVTFKANTRFNPTTNGQLHLGHLYLILVNEYEAHSTGGKFVVRFDDNQEYWRDKIGDARTVAIIDETISDLQWMGIQVDEYISQKVIEERTTTEIDMHMRTRGPVIRGKYFHDEVPETKENWLYYPYTPYYTLEKVWLDFQENINLLVRGIDLITEFAFYEYFVDIMGLPRVHHVYLPRLRDSSGELSNLSKTVGNWKIRELRDRGREPDEIKRLLAVSCLSNPNGPWSIDNVKLNPVLDLEQYADFQKTSSRPTGV